MAYRSRWMPVTPEVSALQRKIRRPQQLMPLRRAEYRAVVSDPQPDGATRTSSTIAKLLNQRKFSDAAHTQSILTRPVRSGPASFFPARHRVH